MTKTITIRVCEVTNREVTLNIGTDITEAKANELHCIAKNFTHCKEGSEEYNTIKEYVGSANDVECGYTQIEALTVDSKL